MRFSARNMIIVLVIFVLFLTFTGAFFIVNETKQAIVLQFGAPRQVISKPGFQFKIPFIQDASIWSPPNLSGSANNLGTVTAGTLGSAVVFPPGFCIKTHYYTDQTGISGYTVTGTTLKAMTETLSVSVTSGNTYEITFNGSVIGGVPSSTNQSIGALAMFAASSSTDIGDTFASNTTALTGHEAGRLDATDDEPDFGFRSHLVYPFVAGSTATQYFTIAGFTTVGTNTITLQASPLALTHGQYYLWRVKEFQGNCLTANYGG